MHLRESFHPPQNTLRAGRTDPIIGAVLKSQVIDIY
jgi:hypothetical protein